ncbi:hypothetical protein GCM10010287_01780 [Streptomyces variabilis]|uniref:Uncharacterized protein n=1 Tax=Streptomyces variabilis TaxID=67372 RepID=A0ABQ2TQI7_9ACTN|nr:hypothetical protein GCM10010287_01780 [Streptomyces variabilis]
MPGRAVREGAPASRAAATALPRRVARPAGAAGGDRRGVGAERPACTPVRRGGAARECAALQALRGVRPPRRTGSGTGDPAPGRGDCGGNPGNRLAPYPFGGQDAARSPDVRPWEAPG